MKEQQIQAVSTALRDQARSAEAMWGLVEHLELLAERAKRDLVRRSGRPATEKLAEEFVESGWISPERVPYTLPGGDCMTFKEWTGRYRATLWGSCVEAITTGEHAKPRVELWKDEGSTVLWVVEIPTPARAAELLEEYGINGENEEAMITVDAETGEVLGGW